jgi:hypothetical protein
MSGAGSAGMASALTPLRLGKSCKMFLDVLPSMPAADEDNGQTSRQLRFQPSRWGDGSMID